MTAKLDNFLLTEDERSQIFGVTTKTTNKVIKNTYFNIELRPD